MTEADRVVELARIAACKEILLSPATSEWDKSHCRNVLNQQPGSAWANAATFCVFIICLAYLLNIYLRRASFR